MYAVLVAVFRWTAEVEKLQRIEEEANERCDMRGSVHV
jgi:hypothetical protein